MKFTDLATRLEEISSKLHRNDLAASKNHTRIRSLETQLDNARDKQSRLRAERVSLIESRDIARREFNARLG